MKKFILLIVVAVLLSACSQSKINEKKKDIVKIKTKYDLRGDRKDGKDAEVKKGTVVIPKNPKRIVTFDYGAVDTIKALGHSSAIKGIAKGKNGESLPEDLASFKQKKYANVGELGKPNYNAVAKQKPDLIIFSGRTASKQVLEELKKAAPNAKLLYIGTDDEQTLSSIKKNTSDLGKIFDESSKAQKYIEKLNKISNNTKKIASKISDKSMILLTSEGELSTYGPKDRFGGLIYNEMGMKPADEKIKAGPHGKPVSLEYVAEEDPDIIFAMDRDKATSGKGTSRKILNNDVLKEVSAVKKKQIIELDPKEWYFSTNGIQSSIKQVKELKKNIEQLK